jgi:hypothetical protein
MRRITTLAAGVPALAALGTAGLAGTASPAGALPGDPLYGDLNGDGYEDRALLTEEGPGTCGVAVQLGSSWSGHYGPVTTYRYDAPGTDIAYCPDLGVIVDLGGDGVSELVLAWFDGAPPDQSDLLVLRDYAPAGGFDAIYQPSHIGTGEFNGDGLLDVYEWTDQGASFITYLNTPTGELVRGPMAFGGQSADNEYRFVDVDADGASDVVFPFVEHDGDGEPSEGVVALLDDGTAVFLEDTWPDDGGGGYGWEVDIVDDDADGDPDVRTLNNATNEVRIHLNNGDGTFTSPK